MNIKISKNNIPLSLKIVFSIVFSLIVIKIYFVIRNDSINVSGSGNVVEDSSVDNSSNFGNITSNSNNPSNIFNITGDVYIENGQRLIAKGDKFYSQEETEVDVRVFSVDEVIEKTPICKYKKAAGEFTLQECYASPEFQERKDAMEAWNVLGHIIDQYPWNVRAKALRLLSDAKNKMLGKGITWGEVLNKLIESMSDDINLMVRREALKTFDELTDFSRRDDFDFIKAVKWWDNPDNKRIAIEQLEKTRSDTPNP